MVNPEGITLNLWADSLLIDFPNENIPILMHEQSWKQWGSDLINTPVFQDNDAPDTLAYDDWYIWAKQVYYTMANYGY